MKKRIIIIIFIVIALVIGLFLLFSFGKVGKVNYKFLNEDKKSIKTNNTIIHAKMQKREDLSSTIKYKGEGYEIKEILGGDVTSYIIYINNIKVWTYDYVYEISY